MSDDFNKDDLPPWLKGDDNDESQPAGDEDVPDWQKGGSGGEGQPTEGKLGFTGELKWRQEADQPEGDASPGDDLPDWIISADTSDTDTAALDDTPDWQTDAAQAGAPTAGGRLGFTGELPWLEQFGDLPQDTPVDRAEAELFGWLDAQADTLPVKPDDLPKQGAPPVPVQTDIPDWLADSGAPAEEDDFLVEGAPSLEFLARGDQLPDTAESELTYDEWLAQQQKLAAGPNLEEETPEGLLGDLEQIPDEVRQRGTTGELPSWYLGLEELSDDDAPDWLNQMGTDDSSAAPDDVPPWIAGDEPPPAPKPTPEPAAPSAFDDDFFASLGIETGGDEDALPTELPDTGELFASLGIGDMSWVDEDSATPPPPRADLPDTGELLASLGIEDDNTSRPVEGELPTNDFLDALLDDAGSVPGDTLPDEETELPDTGLLSGFLEGSAPPSPKPAPSADWLAAFEAQEQESEPDWLASITPESLPAEPENAAIAADEDWLDAMRPKGTAPRAGSAELDTFLSNLDDDDFALPTGAGQGTQTDAEIDLDALFADPAFSDLEIDLKAPDDAPKEGETAIGAAPAVPDFLRELQATVGTVSAAALVRQRQDERGVNELPDRLQRLHLRASQLPVAPEPVIEGGDLSAILPDVRDALPPAAIKVGLTGIENALLLSEEQRQQTSLLNRLVSSGDLGTNRLSAIEATYDTPYLPDLADEDAVPTLADAAPTRPQTRRRRARYKVDRLLIALLLAGLMIAPFFIDQFRIGGLPPAVFAPGSAGMVAFERLEAVAAREPVLIAIEYGASGAAELDGLTDLIVRHLLRNDARPVLVGSNPVGLLHAANLIERINGDPVFLAAVNNNRPFQPNRDYYVVRYLAGAAVGLRAFSENTGAFLLNDLRGQATNLNIDQLSDFAALVVIAENGDQVRTFAEQVGSLAGQPVVIAASAAAAPFAEPYADTLGGGVLVGYRDAYTYAGMLGFAPLSVPLAVTEPVEPAAFVTEEATAEPTEEATAEITEAVVEPVTEEPAAEPVTEEAAPEALEATESATVEAVETVEATPTTPQPSNTPAPTSTPAASATPSATASATPFESPTRAASPTPAPTASATPEQQVILGIVVSNQRVNVRTGPGTSFGVIDSVAQGGEVLVVGRNADGSWYEVIVFETGIRGWMSSQLLRIETEDPVIPETTPLPQGAALPRKATTLLRPAPDLPAQEPTPAGNGGLQGLLDSFLGGDDAPEQATEAADSMTEGMPATEAADSMTEDMPATEAADSMTEDLPATETVIAVESAAVSLPAVPLDMPYRDERWYSMTIGIIASALIITFGTVVNLIRALGRRGKNRR